MGITFLIRRWFHVRTAKKCGIEPDDYANWLGIVKGWPMKRAVPSAIKWRIRKSWLWGIKDFLIIAAFFIAVLGGALLGLWGEDHGGVIGGSVQVIALCLIYGGIFALVYYGWGREG